MKHPGDSTLLEIGLTAWGSLDKVYPLCYTLLLHGNGEKVLEDGERVSLRNTHKHFFIHTIDNAHTKYSKDDTR
jgi:hypothetical protein